MKALRNISCTIFKLIIHNVFENTSSHDSKSYILYLNHVTSYYSISPHHFPWIWIFTPLKCPTNQGLTMICFFHHFYELQSIIKKIWNSKELMTRAYEFHHSPGFIELQCVRASCWYLGRSSFMNHSNFPLSGMIYQSLCETKTSSDFSFPLAISS